LLQKLTQTSRDRRDQADAWYRWAYCHLNEGRWKEAEKGFRQALREDPSDQDSRWLLLESLIEQGQLDVAEAEWTRLSQVPQVSPSELNLWQKKIEELRRHAFLTLSIAGLTDRSQTTSVWSDSAAQLEANFSWRWWKNSNSRLLTGLRASGSFYRNTPTANLQVLQFQNRLVFSPAPSWEVDLTLGLRDLRYQYRYFQDSLFAQASAERFFSKNWSVSIGSQLIQYLTTNLAWTVSPFASLNYSSASLRAWFGASVSRSVGSEALLGGVPLELFGGTLFANSSGASPSFGLEWEAGWDWRLDFSAYRMSTRYDAMMTLSGDRISSRLDQIWGYAAGISRPLGDSSWRLQAQWIRGRNTASGAEELPSSIYLPSDYTYWRETFSVGVVGSI